MCSKLSRTLIYEEYPQPRQASLGSWLPVCLNFRCPKTRSFLPFPVTQTKFPRSGDNRGNNLRGQQRSDSTDCMAGRCFLSGRVCMTPPSLTREICMQLGLIPSFCCPEGNRILLELVLGRQAAMVGGGEKHVSMPSKMKKQ